MRVKSLTQKEVAYLKPTYEGLKLQKLKVRV